MKRILFLLCFLSLMMISLTSQAQVENVIYGKTVTVKTRDTSSAELKILNSTRNTPGYLRNIGGGLTRFVLPDYSELINKPTTFPPSSHTHGNADIIDLAWSKLTGVPDLVLVTRFIDSLVAVQARINTKLNIADASATYITITRTIDSLAALQGRVQTKEPVIAAGTTGQYWRGDKTWQTLDKTAVGLSNVPNTDATNASNISSGTLADARLSSNVTVQGNTFNGSNQLVKLDAGGKLPTSTIPSLALVETFVVNSQAAMLALSAQMGDVAVRTDNNRSYILQSEPASTLSNWVQLLTPDSETDPVYTASSWYSTTNNASNWNTAYSWGNHASAGYALTSGSYSNPSWITSLAWSKLTGVPSTFTPSAHTHPYSDLTGTVPTWNQNTTGTASNVTGVVSIFNGGTGVTDGILDAGSSLSLGDIFINTGIQATPDYLLGQYSNGYMYRFGLSDLRTWFGLGSNAYTSTAYFPLTGGTLTGPLNGTIGTFSAGDAVAGLKVAGATGKLRQTGYYNATLGGIIESVNSAESGFLPLTLEGSKTIINPNGGRLIVGTDIDNGIDIGQFNGSVSITAGGGNLVLKRAAFTDWSFGIGTVNGVNGLHISAGSTTHFSLNQTTGAAIFSNTITATGGTLTGGAVDLNIRPTAGNKGYISFTENAIADRWSIGITNGDGNFYFRYPYASSTPMFTLTNAGVGTFNSSVNSGGYIESYSEATVSAIGFNRKPSTGAIFNSSFGAFQIQNSSGTFQLQSFTSAGSPNGNLITVTEAGVTTFINSVTATSFSGEGTGLNGIASGLSIGGNAATVTNGVYTNTTQTISGEKTFSSTYTYVNTLRASGDVIAYYTSDRRLKKNIKPIANALDKLMLISGNEYDWDETLQSTYSGHDYGVIAQEVESVLPGVTHKKADGFFGVKNQNQIIALLIQALKELKHEVELLKR